MPQQPAITVLRVRTLLRADTLVRCMLTSPQPEQVGETVQILNEFGANLRRPRAARRPYVRLGDRWCGPDQKKHRRACRQTATSRENGCAFPSPESAGKGERRNGTQCVGAILLHPTRLVGIQTGEFDIMNELLLNV